MKTVILRAGMDNDDEEAEDDQEMANQYEQVMIHTGEANADYSCPSDRVAIEFKDTEKTGQLYTQEIQIADNVEQGEKGTYKRTHTLSCADAPDGKLSVPMVIDEVAEQTS